METATQCNWTRSNDLRFLVLRRWIIFIFSDYRRLTIDNFTADFTNFNLMRYSFWSTEFNRYLFNGIILDISSHDPTFEMPLEDIWLNVTSSIRLTFQFLLDLAHWCNSRPKPERSGLLGKYKTVLWCASSYAVSPLDLWIAIRSRCSAKCVPGCTTACFRITDNYATCGRTVVRAAPWRVLHHCHSVDRRNSPAAAASDHRQGHPPAIE